MKYLLLFPLVATAFFASSCRTVPTVDPMTMKLSCRCLPGNFNAHGIDCGEEIIATK